MKFFPLNVTDRILRGCEEGAVTRVFGPSGKNMEKMHNEELNDYYFCQILLAWSYEMWWSGLWRRAWRRIRNIQNLWWKRKPKERDHQKHVLSSDGRVILHLKEKGWFCVGVINLGQTGTVAYCCEYVNEPARSVKCSFLTSWGTLSF